MHILCKMHTHPAPNLLLTHVFTFEGFPVANNDAKSELKNIDQVRKEKMRKEKLKEQNKPKKPHKGGKSGGGGSKGKGKGGGGGGNGGGTFKQNKQKGPGGKKGGAGKKNLAPSKIRKRKQ